ncbi:MSMEG_0567/Sll0786 family nitrogen starvation N-acetyltransferase [Synechocystis sp. LKSZ1]|uniref:MSMEG_0567/Sll0786 family nitrogen starvation N-acetyltransferase n=1 Tax=Synechocystis sp. LKSZ1 TaxID=3144951 RepID=UPI00336BB987
MTHYQFKLATTPEEITTYFALRKTIFVQEQQLFQGSDVDEIDNIAYPIIAVHPRNMIHSNFGKPKDEIVGVVRIYETKPGFWYGGRLGTHPDYRKGWQIGKGLIYKAVTTANTWGCEQFLATVQLQNVRFFQRLHWQSVDEMTICDRPHHLMQADLNYYPATNEVRPALPFQVREAS